MTLSQEYFLEESGVYEKQNPESVRFRGGLGNTGYLNMDLRECREMS